MDAGEHRMDAGERHSRPDRHRRQLRRCHDGQAPARLIPGSRP
jgi:hypothetical protein